MKEFLRCTRYRIAHMLLGEEEVPEKGFKITTWVGERGQHYVEVASKNPLNKEELRRFYSAISDLTGWKDTREVMVGIGKWGLENHSTMRYDDYAETER